MDQLTEQPAYCKFLDFITRNPQVYTMFEKIALECIKGGCKKIGGKMIYEVMRYKRFTSVTRNDSDDYKLNNNYTAYLTRLFIEKHPEHKDKFETRIIKAK